MVQASHTLEWSSAKCQLIWQSPRAHRKPESIYTRLWGLIQTINTTDEQYLQKLHDLRDIKVNQHKRATLTKLLEAKRHHYPHQAFPLIAFHPTDVSYHKVALKQGEMMPLTLVFGGEHRHLASDWLTWFAMRLDLENTGFSLANTPTLTQHQAKLPTLTANKLARIEQGQLVDDDTPDYHTPDDEMTILIDMPANLSLTKSQQTQLGHTSQADILKHALVYNSKKRLCQWFVEHQNHIQKWFNNWEMVLLNSPISLYQLHERHGMQTVSKSSHKHPSDDPKHPSHHAHNTQYHKGYAGWLTLKGAWLEVPQLWEILSNIHLLGQRTHINGLGYFLTSAQLPHASPTLWQRHITDKRRIHHAVNEVLHNHELEPMVDDTGKIMQEEALTELIFNQLKSNTYQPQPTKAIYIPKPSGGKRCIEELEQLDRMVHRLVFDAIAKTIDAYQSPLSLGYRKGYSRQMARDKVQHMIDAGFNWVIEADIEAFFDNVPFASLWQRLRTLLPKREQQTINLIQTLMQAPYQVASATGNKLTVHPRKQGLMQGSPLSPILANLYLSKLDEQINAQHIAFVRYADDVLIFCRTKGDAGSTLDWLQTHLSELGLKLSLSKTAITPVASGFEFLGYRFDKEGNNDKSVVPILRQRKPIMIMGTRKYLGINGAALEVREKRPRRKPNRSLKTSPLSNQLLQIIPLRRISQLVVMGNHALSSPLLSACAKHHISVHIVNQWGFQVGTFKPSHAAYHAVSAQQYQRHKQLKPSERLAIACDLVCAKINNYQTWIYNGYRKGDAIVSKQLTHISEQASSATTLDILRGYEGQAAKLCFKRLQSIIIDEQQAAFTSPRRSRGGVDRLNSLLNFGYYWLFTRISSLLHSHGLNPYLSFLHESEQSYETLVYDVMELFRVQIDKTATRLINRKQIQADSFYLHPKKGWHLKNEALHLYSNQLQATLASKINQTYIEDIILMQVRTLVQWATEPKSLVWFYWYADKNNVAFALLDEDSQTLVIGQ